MGYNLVIVVMLFLDLVKVIELFKHESLDLSSAMIYKYSSEVSDFEYFLA